MTVIYMMFLGSFILVYISFSHFEDQLQDKILRKQSYLAKKQELKKMHKKRQKKEEIRSIYHIVPKTT
jgi:sensor histidine kinase regulating citrate/malate metabolism